MSVLLIDPFSSGVEYHALLGRAHVSYVSVRTLRALDSGLSDGGPVPQLVMDRASLENLPELLRTCREYSVDTVITGTESGVPLAEALKVALGLATDRFDDGGRRYWDKPTLYSVVGRSGLRVPRRVAELDAATARSERSRSLLAGLSYPVVAKPDVGAGSVGVRVVTDPAEAEDAIAGIVASPGFFGGDTPRAVIQEFVAGREFVVDTFSTKGIHRIVAVCTYDKHPSSNGSMVYDRLRWLERDAPETEVLVEYASQVLDALEHREGSVHMEIIADDDGPCLIDLGARPHGAGHPLKTHLLTGSSQLHAEVERATGRGDVQDAGYRLGCHASIEFLSVDREVTVRPDAEPTDLLRPGFVLSGEVPARPSGRYPETHSLLDSEELGLLFVTGADEDEVTRNARELRLSFADMLEELVDAG